MIPPDLFEPPYLISDFKLANRVTLCRLPYTVEVGSVGWEGCLRRNQKPEVKIEMKMKTKTKSETEKYDMIRYITEAKENYTLVAHGAEGFRVYYLVYKVVTTYQAPM